MEEICKIFVFKSYSVWQEGRIDFIVLKICHNREFKEESSVITEPFLKSEFRMAEAEDWELKGGWRGGLAVLSA